MNPGAMPAATSPAMMGAMMPWMGTSAPWFSKPMQAMPPTAAPLQQPWQLPMQLPMQQPMQKPMQQPMQKPMQKPMQQPTQKPWQVPMPMAMPTKAQPAQVAVSAPGPAAAGMAGPTQGMFRIPGFAINLDTPLLQGGLSWPGAQTMMLWPELQGLIQLPGVGLQAATNPDTSAP